MSDRKRNILEAMLEIDYFDTANPQLKTELPYTIELFERNRDNIERLNLAGIVAASAGGAGKSGTQSKVARINEVEDDIRLIAQTARIIAKKFPDFQNTFILPRGNLTYDQTVQYADSFIADAPPHDAKFSLYGLTAAYFANVGTRVAGFRTASQEQADGKRTGVGATAEQEDALKDSLDTRKELDRAIKNYYRNNPQKLAEWLTASHIKRRDSSEPKPPEENPPTP